MTGFMSLHISYNLLNAIFRFQCEFISMTIYIVVTDVVVTLQVPAEGVM